MIWRWLLCLFGRHDPLRTMDGARCLYCGRKCRGW